MELFKMFFCPLFALSLIVLGFTGAPLWAWTMAIALALWIYSAPVALWVVFGALAILFNIKLLRTVLLSSFLMKLLQKLKFIPQISETEKVALKAGDVWVEGELFSGNPHFEKLMAENYPKLTAEEQAFLDGPVEKLCSLATDWQILQNKDLPSEAWELLKKERFFGMIIPKEYGGHGFSALAHGEVVVKLSSRSNALGVTAMVPNSLGPAELLVHFGTEEQKNYYLPRLAKGEEIPCFALTEPGAGSDAASIQSNGVVFKDADGKIKLRLNWNKRYITLAAASTLLGLAFRLKDPDNLLGKGTDPGITCALIPTKTPGVKVDRRHDPMGVPFFNCPTQGKDVVVGLDAVIGGAEGAGKGWGMLMECLGAGRGISLPGQSTGVAKFTTRVVSAYATVRRQFGLSVGKFEGIAEPIARIAGFNYLMEAGRRYTLGAIDNGRKPPVVTAMCKHYFTELQRKIVNDGMDVLGGSAISRGPRNFMALNYMNVPIPITVEGANILTRTLMIFGQGALRAHPFAFKEVDAVENNDVSAFDTAFWGHIGHVVQTTFRAALLYISRGWFGSTPSCHPQASVYFRKLSWTSAWFALLADISMASLGGALKSKGKTTGRFADILAWMYLSTATLRRFEADGRPVEDLPFLHWSQQYSFYQIQLAFEGILENMEVPVGKFFFRKILRGMFALNPIGHVPTNDVEFAVAATIQSQTALRERHTEGMFVPKAEAEPLPRLERAYLLCLQSDAVNNKIAKARRQKILSKMAPRDLYKAAVEKGVISQQECDLLASAEIAREDAIQVDDFGLDEYLQGRRTV